MRISEEPTWKDAKSKPYPKLTENIEADVAVVGGGIAGVLSAYFLALSGKKVVVLEAETIGSGVTAYTTAFLTEVVDTALPDLVKMFGLKKAQAVWESGQEAIAAIEEIVKSEGIECGFMRCPLRCYANSLEDFQDLEKEHAAAAEMGFRALLRRSGELGFAHYGYLEVPRQAKFHPLKFVFGLARAAEKLGVSIFERSKATGIEKGRKKDGELMIVNVGNKEVRAADVIIATYAPFENGKATFLKKGMYISYVMEARLPKGAIEEGLYLDTANPYHYFRIDAQPKHDRIIIGGEDHRKELKIDPEKNYKALEEYLKDILGKHAYTITRRWSSKVLEPTDGLPLIGRIAPHKLVATAFSGNGMTYSAIAAMVFRDLLAGRGNPWAETYDPKRVPNPYQLLKKGQDYVGEFFGASAKNLLIDK